jgi:predicted unusual protein kinase regulating ubiquinone biosynthesis (AarF/ABC1/UbiB family)
VAEVHFEAGYVPPDRDIDEFARALRAVGEPIFGMDASRISMARLLSYLFEVTERFGMETRTELILLQRTMVVVEGVARVAGPAHQHLAGRKTHRRGVCPPESGSEGAYARFGQDYPCP